MSTWNYPNTEQLYSFPTLEFELPGNLRHTTIAASFVNDLNNSFFKMVRTARIA
jgi:hypothetical protein